MNYILWITLIPITLYMLSILCLFIVDPLQIFHKPWVREEYFIPQLRFQAAGIINNSEFDSFILGTSMGANFSPEEASQLLGGKFVNISLDGGYLSERGAVFRYALKNKKIKKVIITLDGFGKVGSYNPNFDYHNFSYLYNDYRFDDIRIYMSNKYKDYLFCKNKYISFDNYVCDRVKNLTHVTEWASEEHHMKKYGGLNKWFAADNDHQVIHAFKEIVESTECIKNNCDDLAVSVNNLEDSAGIEAFDEYVLKQIKKYPDTEFYLVFPPYSRMRYAMSYQGDRKKFERHLIRIRYVLNVVEQYNNVKVFGYDDMDFLDDIANYRDTGHYHPRINSMILKSIKNDAHRLTNDNVDNYIKKATIAAKNYDIVAIGQKIKQYLEDNELMNIIQ